jgi:excisionase family DNA binding protein
MMPERGGTAAGTSPIPVNGDPPGSGGQAGAPADPGGCGLGASGAPLSPVLTVDELAALLRLERKAVYAAIRRGEIPGVIRVGRAIRICREAVVEWLRSGQGRESRSRRRG